ncbi:MAG: inositol monophosphatase family protein [Deltaproteobacteria bacterium]
MTINFHQIASSLQDERLLFLLQQGCEAAIKAGRILRDLSDNPHHVRLKGAVDLVTEADLASEKAIMELFREKTPEVAILSEESAADFSANDHAGPCWVIDPLDGTTNYAHGFPWYAVSIAYTEKRCPVIGIVNHVPLDQLFIAVTGHGAWLNGNRLGVSRESVLQRSLLATGFPYDVERLLEPVIGAIRTILPLCQGLRRAGAAALDLALVASGRLDGFWELNLKPWDTAAGMLLVEEAGGRVSDYQGRPYSPFTDEIVATNGLIHGELQQRLANFSQR